MKSLTIVNRTDDTLVYAHAPRRDLANAYADLLLPAGSATLTLSNSSSSLFLTRQCHFTDDSEKKTVTSDKLWSIDPDGWCVSLPLSLGVGAASWKALQLPLNCPWRAYRFRVSQVSPLPLLCPIVTPRKSLFKYHCIHDDDDGTAIYIIPSCHIYISIFASVHRRSGLWSVTHLAAYDDG